MIDPVLALLNEKGLSFTVSGKDYLIQCLNPEHDDSNPSCRVDKITGVLHCFSCGFKRNLFRHFGILTNPSSIRIAKLKLLLKELKETNIELKLPDGATPYNQIFRGISVTTLKHFGAFYTNSVTELADRVVFPITDAAGKYVVFVGRHALSNGNPRYVNYPRGVKIPIFPVILDEPTESIVLVEGILDMMNLYDKGLHSVVASFGTSTLKGDTANKLLPLKAQGVSRIFIMYDGDTAGREAARELKPLIEECGFEVKIIDLPDDTDPGDMCQEDVDSIREYIK